VSEARNAGPNAAPARWVARIAKAERHELGALAWSFTYFFLLLAAYYVLRPVRTEMAVQTGVKNLPWLITATFLTTLAIQPLFGWLTARVPRSRLLPGIYAFFALNLVGFYTVFGLDAQEPWLARTFYVWLSVFNFFVVSVFWSFMADVFSTDQGKRLFAVIAAGGSLGAIAGAGVPAFAATTLGIANLMLVSAVLLSACIVCIHGLRRWALAGVAGAATSQTQDAAVGGGPLSGIRQALSTPYLGGISVYILLWTYSGIVLDLEIARVLGESIASPLERTQLAARIEQAVSLTALLAQLLLTNRLIERLGLFAALGFLPLVNLVGFLGLAFAPSLALLMVFDVARRAGEYAISKPAREVLFTVVDREAKYKAKNFIDTAVARGGTVASGWIVNGLKAIGASGAALALTVVPIALVWVMLAWMLARRQITFGAAPAGGAVARIG
jgi:AAA family ATP:ADP antiporter